MPKGAVHVQNQELNRAQYAHKKKGFRMWGGKKAFTQTGVLVEDKNADNADSHDRIICNM